MQVMVKQPVKIFLVSRYLLFAIPALELTIKQCNGKLVGTQTELNSVSFDRNLKKTQPDILILTLEAVKADCELIKQIKEALPHLKIILIAKGGENMLSLIQSPASGVILVNEDFKELIRAIENLNLEQNYYSPKVLTIMAQEMISSYLQLSPREMEIFLLLKSKKSRSQVCQILNISRSTLRVHIRNIKLKLEKEPQIESL